MFGKAAAGAALLAAAVVGLAAARAAEPEGGFVPVTGGRLHVVVLEPRSAPSGRTLLLLHGASGNLRDMQESIGERLAAHHRVILIDRPGHGYSDRLGGRPMASPRRQADAIAEALDRMKIGRAVVVGHSWSGALATNLALDHPSKVSGLVLLSPATHPYPGGAAWYNSIAATPVIGVAFAAMIRPVADSRFDDAMTSVFAPRPPPPDYVARTEAKLLLRPAEFVANAEDLVDLKPFLRAQAPRYGAIRVPTVIITADRDTIVSPELHSRQFHRQVRGSRLVVLEGAGHTPHWNATDRVVREIDGVAAKAR